MKINSLVISVTTSLSLAVVATGVAISAQDRYTVKVPGGLAFAEFKGYETWQTIAISKSETAMAVILGNPAMIAAYKAGIPANGKPFPDGAKMAKIHWVPKKNELAPGTPLVPGNLHDIDFMVKDGSGSRTAAGGATARLSTTPRPRRSDPATLRICHRRRKMPSAASGVTRSSRIGITSSRTSPSAKQHFRVGASAGPRARANKNPSA